MAIIDWYFCHKYQCEKISAYFFTIPLGKSEKTKRGLGQNRSSCPSPCHLALIDFRLIQFKITVRWLFQANSGKDFTNMANVVMVIKSIVDLIFTQSISDLLIAFNQVTELNALIP